MTTDLAVETTLLRQAADILDDAAAAFAGGGAGGGRGGGDPGGGAYSGGGGNRGAAGHLAGDCPSCPLSDTSLGRSAVGREVVEAASRRVEQAVEATRLLAGLVSVTADKLRITAAAFDAAEFAAVGPHR